jgi:hypothetical protein
VEPVSSTARSRPELECRTFFVAAPFLSVAAIARDGGLETCDSGAMSKGIVGIGFLVVASIIAGVLVTHRDSVAVRRELSLLRAEVTAVKRLSLSASKSRDTAVLEALAPAPEPGKDLGDIGKLRQELAGLKENVSLLTELAATQAPAGPGGGVATSLRSASDLKNVGRATPEASTETALWAAVEGDVDTLVSTMTFTPSARIKADKWFASLSEGIRQQHGSPEKIIALMIARGAAELSGMQILGQKTIGTGQVGLKVRLAAGDDVVKDETFLMQRADSGWQMVLPDGAVEKYARRLAGAK